MLTGNVLVLFDARRLTLDDLRHQIARETAAYRPGRRPPAARNGRVPPAPAADEIAWHTRPAEKAIQTLKATPEVGLTTVEADRRLAANGPNRLPAPRPKSALTIVWEQIGSLPVLLLGGAAVVSIATGGLIDGAAILVVIGVNAAIGYATESRVERILASLSEVGVPMAIVRRDGHERVVPRADLVPGDVMLLRPGHDVPADGRLIAVRGLQTDESTLTGEAATVVKARERV